MAHPFEPQAPPAQQPPAVPQVAPGPQPPAPVHGPGQGPRPGQAMSYPPPPGPTAATPQGAPGPPTGHQPQSANPYLNLHPGGRPEGQPDGYQRGPAGGYPPPARGGAPGSDPRQSVQQGGRRWKIGLGRGTQGAPRERERLARLQQPTPRPYRLSVTSIKGGVGKTTTSALLGLTFAHYRADNTVVVDANPHAGTLADRLLGERVIPTVRDLVNAELRERSYNARGLVDAPRIHQYLGQAGRLMVAASEQNSELSDSFDENQYRTAQEVLGRAFDVIITDSGTGMRHSAMRGTLAATDRLVVVAAPRYDAARRAAKTLDEVYARGYPHLVRDAVVVITMDAPKAVGINVDTLVDYFQQLCTAVVKIPYDHHLYAGGTIDYDRVSAATRGAYMDLAALLADGFGRVSPGS